jgi:hypothetical protein
MERQAFEKLLLDAAVAYALHEFDHAEKLYRDIARIEHESAAQRPKHAIPDRAPVYELKAALSTSRNSFSAEAEAELLRAVAFEWGLLGMHFDPGDVEEAFLELLLRQAVRGDRERFRALFEQANACMNRLRVRFPQGAEAQGRLLTACFALDWRDECKQLLRRIETDAGGSLDRFPEFLVLAQAAARKLGVRINLEAGPEDQDD